MFCSYVVICTAFLCVSCVCIIVFDVFVLCKSLLLMLPLIFIISIPCMYCSFSKVHFQDMSRLLLVSFDILTFPL